MTCGSPWGEGPALDDCLSASGNYADQALRRLRDQTVRAAGTRDRVIHMFWLCVALFSLLLLPGCSALLPDPTQVQLRTHPISGCLYVNLGPSRLEADADAPAGEQVWVVPEGNFAKAMERDRLWPVWPLGYTAKFAPELRVFDQDGALVISEGQSFHSGASGSGVDGSDYHICGLTVTN